MDTQGTGLAPGARGSKEEARPMAAACAKKRFCPESKGSLESQSDRYAQISSDEKFGKGKYRGVWSMGLHRGIIMIRLFPVKMNM